ncbi:MAG: EamA family transporter [Firmicutes bacterium]|nr:EamA family transporter [Bacillota bacterium]
MASRVVPVTAAYPIVAVLLGWMVLKEGLTPLKVLGSILIIAGILLIKR